MRVLLVYPTPPASCWPRGIARSQWVPTGIACIAGVLQRAGHQVKVCVVEEELVRNNFNWQAVHDDLRTLMREFSPQMLGLSLVTASVDEGVSIAADAKSICGDGCLVVAGGPHPTVMPEQLLSECPHIDVAALGEGELTMLDLAERGPGASVEGIAFRNGNGAVTITPRRTPVTDLDSLGPPAYELFKMDYYVARDRWMIRWLPLSVANIRTSRGCSNSCMFCGGHLVSGVGVRCHSIGYVIDQMIYVHERFGVEAVHFEDDTLGADRSRLMGLCREIRRSGLDRQLAWDACLRADQVDSELLAEMKRAGCIQIECGFESGSTDSLGRLGKRTTDDINREAVTMIRRAGLRVMADIMVGLPGETSEDIRKTIAFLRWARPEVISAGRLCPLPGTPLYKGLSEQIRRELKWGGYAYFDSPGRPVNLTAMSDEKFNDAYRRFLKYTVRPQMRWALYRDTPRSDKAARRQMLGGLVRFAVRHPIKALRVPW